MNRTDIHRPAAIVPADYVWVSFDYYGAADLGALMELRSQRLKLHRHMERTGGRYTDHEHGGTCAVCGASAAYVSIFYHERSNRYLVVGWECAQKLELSQDGGRANLFRAGIRDALEAQAGKRKAQATLAGLGLSAAWTFYDYVGDQHDEQTVRDIVGKLVRYGSLSEKQVTFLVTLLDRIARRPEIEAQRAAERAATPPVPTGRVAISGLVLSTKLQESDYSRFGVLKMLVKNDAGWKVWGTAPASLVPANGGGLKGCRVSFTATVKASPDDPTFGFYSRPTGGRILEEGQQ